MSKIQKWGNATWYLFHIIAEKMTDDIFNKESVNLIGLLRQICNTLPCPDCANHATKYFQKVNFDLIKNKEDFKIFIFDFHNQVNTRVNKPKFTIEELNNKYKNTNLKNSIHFFINNYFTKTNNERMFLYSYQRNLIKHKLYSYLVRLEGQLFYSK
jgi:hypothetical protein